MKTVNRNEKYFVVYKKQMFDYLTEKGFKPFKVRLQKTNLSRFEWVYANTPEFANTAEEYFENLERMYKNENN